MLIVLAPILALGFWYDKLGRSRVISGMMYAAASGLCFLFHYDRFGTLYWDLRYIPLVAAFLYTGRMPGLVVCAVILIIRAVIGGDGQIYGYMTILLSAALPYAVSDRLLRLEVRERIWRVMLVGCWPLVVSLSVLLTYLMINGSLTEAFEKQFGKIGVLAAVYLFGTGSAMLLNETILERNIMRHEIRRAEKSSTLGELAASIAHEVRNPLTVVKGFVHLMNEQRDGKYLHYLPLVMEELDRTENIISDYLNFAKPQLDKIGDCSLADIIGSAIQLLEPFAAGQSVVLEKRIARDAFLLTDRSQLEQAIVNLVKNGIEASPSGGKVTVTLTGTKGQALIRIADSGKGMDSSQLAKIGTLYYSTKDKGTGLGTVVALRIIEAMNGRVEYVSRVNEGTEVSVTLPLVRRGFRRGAFVK